MATYKEYVFESDSIFNRPKILEDSEAISTLIVRLILLEPGTNPNRPEMGVGLVSRFRYMDETNINELSKTIQTQIVTYLPYFQQINVELSASPNNIINIDVQADGEFYRFEASSDDNGNVTIEDLINQ